MTGAPCRRIGRAFSFGAFVRGLSAAPRGPRHAGPRQPGRRRPTRRCSPDGHRRFRAVLLRARGRRPDGSETKVAFTLAFATGQAAPQAGFFVCQHHFPENFWNPEFQHHDNGATAIASVTLAAPDPERHRGVPDGLHGRGAERARRRRPVLPLWARTISTCMTPDDAARGLRLGRGRAGPAVLRGFRRSRRRHRAAGDWLDAAGDSVPAHRQRLIVPASVAFGVAIAFEPRNINHPP